MKKLLFFLAFITILIGLYFWRGSMNSNSSDASYALKEAAMILMN